MGDRIAVMRKGELQQVGNPQDLYDRPVNLFVGGFIGSPAMNMLEGTLVRSEGLAARSAISGSLGAEALTMRTALEAYEGRTIIAFAGTSKTPRS